MSIKGAVNTSYASWSSWRSWSLWAMNPALDHVPHGLQNTDKSSFPPTWPNSLRINVKLPLFDRNLTPFDRRYRWRGWLNWWHRNLEHIYSNMPMWLVLQNSTWNLEINKMAAGSSDGCGISRWLRNQQKAAECLQICQKLNKTITH